ncbi:MAG TPA: ATPase, T2SS/T4P/T4SS family [Vicinamibacterales bacterium]|nr:ATPase, T2SS/T4P/T4SS family [Vicinamibacterales bacterium]
MSPDRGVRQSRGASPARRVPALPGRVRDAFGAALVHECHITQTALQTALDRCAKDGQPLCDAVVALGYVDEDAAYRLLATVAGITFDDRGEVDSSPLAIKLVPARVARRHELVPVAVDDKTVRYLTATPYDVDAERDVSFATGRVAVAILARRSVVQAAIARLYPESIVEATRPDRPGPGPAPARAGATIELAAAAETSPDSAIINLCHSLLARAIEANASDLHFDPAGNGLVVQMRVAGVLETAMTIPANVVGAVVSRLKTHARVGTAVRNRPQEGVFTFQLSGRRVDVRLSTVPTAAGEKLLLRITDKQRELLAIDALGYAPEMLERLTRALDQPRGLVLMTGPVGCGKTTSLYAALQYLQSRRANVVSVEEQIEQTVPGINQIAVNIRAGGTIVSALRSAVALEPDVLMVGELRDAEVAAIAWEAANAGCLVLSSVETLDAAAAVTHLLNLGLEPQRITDCLKGIVDLRLARRLCTACHGKTSGSGCVRCRSTGFAGRVALADLLTPTDAISTAITRGQTSMDIRRAMEAAGFPSIKDHANALVAAGVTSRDEAARVVGAVAVVESAAVVEPVSSPPRPSVLIADDEPITRTLVRLLLERDGYSVIEAHNGREAVDLAVRHTPSLIVMDLNMPQMDGYEAIKEIRRVHGLESAPIVVVTMEDGANVAEQVLSLGADDYIMKPFEPSVLTARVKAAFGRQRLAA